MSDPNESTVKEALDQCTDQVDGGRTSRQDDEDNKGVRVSDRLPSPKNGGRRGAAMPMVQSPVPGLRHGSAGGSTVIAIGPQHRVTSTSPEPGRPSLSRPETISPREQRRAHRKGAGEPGMSRQTLEELKNYLREEQREDSRPGGHYSYVQGSRADTPQHHPYPHSDLQEGTSVPRSFFTFKPLGEGGSRRPSRPGERIERDFPNVSTSASTSTSPSSYTSTSTRDNTGYCQPDGGPRGSERARGGGGRSRSCDVSGEDMHAQQEESSRDSSSGGFPGPITFFAFVERIKQEIAREGVNFVRFEATDLHGVSRSKIVPARFFQEKAIHGLPMPRSNLELTLSSRVNEVDNGAVVNFNSDILLVADMATFKILPWANHTGRVICDPCTVTGVPLRTSPRLIAKQLLSQLQGLGFSLHSSLTYECCLLGLPDRVGPKAVFFPATTLLSNNDLPFLHQLITGMYYMGVDVESFASAGGPGQMEICLKPKFGIEAADSAFTFRTGIKEMALKHNYIASFYTDDGIYNSGVFSHSLWDANGRRCLFHSNGGGGTTSSGGGGAELSEIGRRWLAGLLHHSAAISCLLSPGVGCRNQLTKGNKDQKQRTLYATHGCNDNSCAFNVKFHGSRETHIDNKLGSAMANPYVVLAATLAAGMDGIRRNLSIDYGSFQGSSQQKQFSIPLKLESALEALAEDSIICGALGEPFVQYFIAMKKFEIETQELDADSNKSLEYFI